MTGRHFSYIVEQRKRSNVGLAQLPNLQLGFPANSNLTVRFLPQFQDVIWGNPNTPKTSPITSCSGRCETGRRYQLYQGIIPERLCTRMYPLLLNRLPLSTRAPTRVSAAVSTCAKTLLGPIPPWSDPIRSPYLFHPHFLRNES